MPKLQIILVARDSGLIRAAREIALRFKERNFSSLNPQSLFGKTLQRVSAFIDSHTDFPEFAWVECDSLSIALEQLQVDPGAAIGPLWIERETLVHQDPERPIEAFFSHLENLGLASSRSAYSTTVFISSQEFNEKKFYSQSSYILRVLDDDHEALCVELLCRLMDFLDFTYLNKFSQRVAKRASHGSVLGQELSQFMASDGRPWIFSYYTGSIVSTLINTIESSVHESNGICVRGPNEHSLACGALANYLLFQRPFVTVVTSGMIDEFKGTLANLCQAHAEGFIVCGNNRAEQWYAFQGGSSQDENVEAVLGAKGISFVSIKEIEELSVKLQLAFLYFEQKKGPVVILATQKVLEFCADASKSDDARRLPCPSAIVPSSDEESLTKILDVINNDSVRLLWQCNNLNDDERELVYEIAQMAGVGLCDSLVHPGSVSEFDAPPGHFLGTLGLYGTSDAVHHYLYSNQKLRPRNEQWLFLLKSKVPQAATPFSEAELRNKLNIVQIDKEPNRISPYTDIPVKSSLLSFLRFIRERLHVGPSVLAYRRGILSMCDHHKSHIAYEHGTLPMTTNYFHSQLRQVLQKQIIHHNYRYLGIYDVGRFGVSAIRDLPRTGKGFSGWYGRALMGDAYLAALSLAQSVQSNLLAFVGDGAKYMVGSVEPFLMEYLSNGGRIEQNITFFFGFNGTTSLIESYQNRARFERSSRQLKIMNPLASDREYEFENVRVRHLTLRRFDQSLLNSLLSSKASVNFIDVILSHNSEASGISTMSYDEWQTR